MTRDYFAAAALILSLSMGVPVSAETANQLAQTNNFHADPTFVG